MCVCVCVCGGFLSLSLLMGSATSDKTSQPEERIERQKEREKERGWREKKRGKAEGVRGSTRKTNMFFANSIKTDALLPSLFF